jgi:two-component system response regulator HydG
MRPGPPANEKLNLMRPQITRIFERSHAEGRAVLAVATGSGRVARHAFGSGCDLAMALNSGAFRMYGFGSFLGYLPLGDAHEQTRELLRRHILPHRLKGSGVLAGVSAANPNHPPHAFLAELKALDVDGVVNWPAVSLLHGPLRTLLDDAGLGWPAELALLRQAREQSFFTAAFVNEPSAIADCLDAGIDAIVVHLGLTRAQFENIRDKRDQLQRAITQLKSVHDQVTRHAGPRPLILAYGGPITQAEDLELVLRQCPIDGFAGGSAFERIPFRDSLNSILVQFRNVVARPPENRDDRGIGAMVGTSAPMKRLFDLLRKVSPFDVNLYIEGESGVGKELVATQIHQLSGRSREAFVTLNCGSIPDTLLESELFGHEKGSFTGAHRRRLGKFELAHKGTLFLDEVADLSPHGQVALLRAIQQREIMRVGAESPIPVNVRIISASNRSLASLVEEGKFRADLYYRLNGFTLEVPALRERRDDIPLIVEEILARLSRMLNRRLRGITPRFRDRLIRHAWPGNVRELEHVIMQAAMLEGGPVIEGLHFAPRPVSRSVEQLLPKKPFEKLGPDAKRRLAEETLADCGGNKSRAASTLGLTRKTFYAWLGTD